MIWCVGQELLVTCQCPVSQVILNNFRLLGRDSRLLGRETEQSPHPASLEALAGRIATSSVSAPIRVVMHAAVLAESLAAAGTQRIDLVRDHGETRVVGQDLPDLPS
jgi:predicted ATPase